MTIHHLVDFAFSATRCALRFPMFSMALPSGGDERSHCGESDKVVTDPSEHSHF
jgi:hypothetical protein